MKKLILDWFTENDSVSFCPATALMIAGGFAMIVQFIIHSSTDFQGLGIGLAAIGAGKALKTMSEK